MAAHKTQTAKAQPPRQSPASAGSPAKKGGSGAGELPEDALNKITGGLTDGIPGESQEDKHPPTR